MKKEKNAPMPAVKRIVKRIYIYIRHGNNLKSNLSASLNYFARSSDLFIFLFFCLIDTKHMAGYNRR